MLENTKYLSRSVWFIFISLAVKRDEEIDGRTVSFGDESNLRSQIDIWLIENVPSTKSRELVQFFFALLKQNVAEAHASH